MNELHDDVVLAILLTGVIDGGNMRMIETRQGKSFNAEASASFAIRKHAGREHFDGDFALELFIAGAIDNAHAAHANRLQDGIADNVGAVDWKIHRRRSGVAIKQRGSGSALTPIIFDKQHFYGLAERRIALTGGGEKLSALLGRHIDGLAEKLLLGWAHCFN